MNKDSLLSILPNLADTSKCRALNKIAYQELLENHLDKAMDYSQKALAIALSSNQKNQEIRAYYNLGLTFDLQNNYSKAIEFIKKGLETATNTKLTKETAEGYHHLGNIYLYSENYQLSIENQLKAIELFKNSGQIKLLSEPLSNLSVAYFYSGNYSEALKYSFEVLKLYEKEKNESEITSTQMRIGNIYFFKSEYNNALKYYSESLTSARAQKNKEVEADILGNIGNVYLRQNKFTEALTNYLEALDIKNKVGTEEGKVNELMNIGLIYMNLNNSQKSRTYFNEALDINKKTGNKKGEAECLVNLSELCAKEKNYLKAIEFSKQGIEIAKSIGNKELLKTAYESLAENEFKSGNFKNAYELHKLYSSTKDSLLNKENSKAMLEMQTKYQTEKQDLLIESLNKEKALQDQRLANEKIVKNGLIAGCVLLLAVAFLILNGYQQKKKANKDLEEKNISIQSQKEIIEKQKTVVEFKNKEITDSINYAKRIQDAIIPSQRYVKSLLNHVFVLFKPKDIVSGDFYWFGEKNNKIFFAAVDCTGHGVPGAFMSMIGHNLLNEIILEKGITKPSEILDKLNESIRTALKQDTRESDTRDGMDIALCSYDKNNNLLEYAGANRPLYHFVDQELNEIKPNKFPIGGLQLEEKIHFTNHQIQVNKGDSIYIFSDGYADQFGGPDGKKFMAKQLKSKLKEILPLASEEQKNILNDALSSWQADHEQVDDILVIGVKF